jgi:HTH-like domain
VSVFVDEHRERFGVEPICKTLEISASAYYQRAKGERSARSLEDERLTSLIAEIHEANYCAYGYRRMWIALQRAGAQVGRGRVARLMREAGIQGAKRRGRPWQLASHMRTDLVLDALRMALGQRQPGADVELVAHTDRGSQGRLAACDMYIPESRKRGVLCVSAITGKPGHFREAMLLAGGTVRTCGDTTECGWVFDDPDPGPTFRPGHVVKDPPFRCRGLESGRQVHVDRLGTRLPDQHRRSAKIGPKPGFLLQHGRLRRGPR